VGLDIWDVDPADLEVAGQPWEAVIPADVDNGIDDSIRPLPQLGWREVAIQIEDPSTVHGRLFAAPEGEKWAVAHVSSPLAGGKPILSAGPVVRLRPGMPSRRHGLRLIWPTPVEVRASELQDLQITLVNIGDVTWVADPQDGHYVHGWLLDGDGDRLGSSWIAFGGLQHILDQLAPGQVAPLPVSFGPRAHLAAVGVYGVEAVMPSLNLWSARTTIAVLP
jgi:hypothetical protein